jgi:hypothetical protein
MTSQDRKRYYTAARKTEVPAVKVTLDRIMALAETHEPDDIAEILHIPVGQVNALMSKAPPQRCAWFIECNKTGRRWKARTERGAYRLACILGLTDYKFWGVERTK